MPLSDIEIAQQAKLQRVTKIAEKLGIPEEHLVPYGHYKAKVVARLRRQPEGRRRTAS